ncbi:flagellar basal-body MS-ring/collar protein FliF [Teredinibacter sp. KSP-S5-2]|uniref:flagellar basal-body MS-ring/collar protein FliF n=1 Tax=Teredinibacter sp. KSP-S5-2 TaxID=3034506 RepID=UPI002934503C|nr:flagellar basal-body MS-ring/collar protein FliF [Teredinibacter sp. KSP-S5-2]WNO11340.1 flagellar basal-body MS-ring/collar protein FliF [Teredinibacter sp. KSP-S5-2]
MADLLIFQSKKNGLILGIVLIVAIAIGATWWILSPKWTPVIGSEMNPDTKLKVQNHLMEWGIPYREESQTGAILVQNTSLLDVRSRLNEYGIPSETKIGFELFNEAEYGMSEFTQRINYQRALETEIAKTVAGFSGVKNARVHLSLPKESIFKDKSSIPKASVTITAIRNTALSDDQIEGIRRLVATSVDQLSTENVVVLDERGRVISFIKGSEKTFGIEQNRNLELSYEEKIKNLVIEMLKTKNVQAVVSIKYNMDKIKSIREEILPNNEGNNGGYPIKSVSKKTSDGELKNAQNNSSLEQEFIYSREKSEIEYATGGIEKISVGIVIGEKITTETKEIISALVSSALGLEKERGDTISVAYSETNKEEKSAKDSDSTIATPPEKSSLDKSIYKDKKTIYVFSVILLLITLILIITTTLLRKTPRKEKQLSQEEMNTLLLEIKQWANEQVQDKNE